MLEAHTVDRGEVAEPACQPFRHDGGRLTDIRVHGREHDRRGLRASVQRHIGLFERAGAGAGQNLRRRSFGEHAPGIDRHDPIETLSLLHVGGGDQYGEARPVRPDVVDEPPELPARQRIDAGGRLVQDQEIGIVDQGAAERELLLHPAGQLAGRAIRKGMQPGRAQEARAARATLGRRLPEQASEIVDVLHDREARIEIAAQALRHVGDARHDAVAVRRRSDVAAERANGPGLQAANAGDQAEQGRFSDPIRPHQRGRAAGPEREADAGERRRLAVALRDTVDLDAGRLSERHRATARRAAAARPRRRRPERRHCR